MCRHYFLAGDQLVAAAAAVVEVVVVVPLFLGHCFYLFLYRYSFQLLVRVAVYLRLYHLVLYHLCFFPGWLDWF